MTKAADRHQEIKYEQMATRELVKTISTPDLWKTRVRLLARGGGQTTDISSLVSDLTWQDQSSDQLQNINTQAAMVGSITLHKPNLRDYKKLTPLVYPGESLTARVVNHKASQGALGVVIICQIGYGKTYQNVWAMRVVPGYDNATAESVTLSDGSWVLNLADDLWTLSQTTADFKFKKGKRTRKAGWRCDEIARQVCRQYKVPVRTLAKGTAYFELTASATTLTSPVAVIAAAYQEETKRTGRTFIIRWGAPDKKHPLGALEVIPMRRNRLLYQFRDQLLDATLTRSQGTDFATVVEARGQLQDGKKTRKITYTATNGGAVRRFGFIRKTVNFGKVSSRQELKILAIRSLAVRLTPIRTADLSHPGIATIRRGDAIHINLPEEGYSRVKLAAYETPGQKKRPKGYVKALRAAEKANPALFNLADPALAKQAADDTGATETKKDANVPAILPVADQGVAFVTSATHTLSAGTYTVDLQMGFIDVLDPKEVRAQVDKAVRDFKTSQKKGAKKGDDTGGASGTITVGATWFGDCSGAYGNLCDGGYYYAELGQAGANAAMGGLLGKAFGRSGPLPPGTRLAVTYGGRTITAIKRDIGSGQAGDTHYKIDLHEKLARELNFVSAGKADVQVRLV